MNEMMASSHECRGHSIEDREGRIPFIWALTKRKSFAV